MQFASIYYLFCGLYLLSLALGCRYNQRGLKRAVPALIVLGCGLLWLLLQLVLPFQAHLPESIFDLSDASDWYQPSGSLTIVPARTRWLIAANLFALSWLLLSIAIVRNRRRIKQLLIALIVIGAIHGLVGIFAKYAGVYLVDKEQLDGHWTAARGWFVNRNHFAAFILLTLSGPVTFLIKSQLSAATRHPNPTVFSKLSNLIFGPYLFLVLATGLGLAAMVLSQSRGGLISLAGSIVMLSLISFWASKSQHELQHQFRNLAAKSLFLFLAVSVVFIAWFGQDLGQRLASDAFGYGERGVQWEITLRSIMLNPWVGYGGGSYASVFQIFRESEDLRQVVFDQSHNDYLHIWLEQGLIGLVLWLGFLFAIARQSATSLLTARSKLVAALIISCSLLVVAALIQSMVDFNLQIVSIRVYFFVLVALLFAAPAVHRHR